MGIFFLPIWVTNDLKTIVMLAAPAEIYGMFDRDFWVSVESGNFGWGSKKLNGIIKAYGGSSQKELRDSVTKYAKAMALSGD